MQQRRARVGAPDLACVSARSIKIIVVTEREDTTIGRSESVWAQIGAMIRASRCGFLGSGHRMIVRKRWSPWGLRL